MNAIVEQNTSYNHLTIVRLAREIAMDIRGIDEILEIQGVSKDNFEKIRATKEFERVLQNEVEAWNSATNTAERVRLKSLSFVEESLADFYSDAVNKNESLSARTEVLKTVARFAGIGGSGVDGAINGEKFFVTINLGADKTLKIEKDVTPKVIDAEDYK
jgi:hypothetical protein